MLIYCCTCQIEVDARLTNGAEIYPHRTDLACIPFWRCDTCKGYVGTHHKTRNYTQPLGFIPSKEIMRARREIHAILDPLWKGHTMSRREVYGMLSKALGYSYHTAEIKTIEQARHVYITVRGIRDALHQKTAC